MSDKSKSLERKNELIKIGAQIFSKNGFYNTSLEDIAKAAGVTRGAIYHNFGNKLELCRNIVERYNEFIDEILLKDLYNGSSDSICKLTDCLNTFFNHLEKDQEFRIYTEVVMKLRAINNIEEFKNDFNFRFYKDFNSIKDVLDKAKLKGEIKKSLDTKSFTFVLMTSIIGVIENWIFNQKIISLNSCAEQITEMIICRTRLISNNDSSNCKSES
ncbi:MAG: TetR/AcrR family transcriptional regulator [Rhodothermaceae bacterium]